MFPISYICIIYIEIYIFHISGERLITQNDNDLKSIKFLPKSTIQNKC